MVKHPWVSGLTRYPAGYLWYPAFYDWPDIQLAKSVSGASLLTRNLEQFSVIYLHETNLPNQAITNAGESPFRCDARAGSKCRLCNGDIFLDTVR
jgi:hypothetical protein